LISLLNQRKCCCNFYYIFGELFYLCTGDTFVLGGTIEGEGLCYIKGWEGFSMG